MTPVVIFIYKRFDTLPRIFEQIRHYRPRKLYILSDGPKKNEDKQQVQYTRELALKLIDWDCEIIKRFHDENVGVYQNIGMGATWVFKYEERAIFLEDDSLPASTFFKYCDELLDRYENNEKIFWICGTNYDRKQIPYANTYYYTKCLLPCGWASWGKKFPKFYDGNLVSLSHEKDEIMKTTYLDYRLYLQEIQAVRQTAINLNRNIRSVSWDRQMIYTIRANNLYGIAPAVNQIQNIGADNFSEHGGNDLKKVMTFRFCEVPTQPLQFPLMQPRKIEVNKTFERFTEGVILYPIGGRLRRYLGRILKVLIGLSADDSLRLFLKNKPWKR